MYVIIGISGRPTSMVGVSSCNKAVMLFFFSVEKKKIVPCHLHRCVAGNKCLPHVMGTETVLWLCNSSESSLVLLVLFVLFLK